MVYSGDPRVDGVNEGINSVLLALHVIWQRRVAILICVLFPLAHFQLPLWKLPLRLKCCVELLSCIFWHR